MSARVIDRAGFGRALEERIHETGTSVAKVAASIGVTAQGVYNWINATATPKDPEMVFALEDLLECPGELSVHLGYARLGERPEVLRAIDLDGRIDADTRRILKLIYRQNARRGGDHSD